MKSTLFLLVPLFFLGLTACELPFLTGQNQSEYHRSVAKAQKMRESSQAVFVESLDRWLVFFWLEGPYPSPMQVSSYEILFLDSQSRLSSLPETVGLQVFAWMPDMGHGSADDGYVEDLGGGRFLGHELRFNMPGYWHIHILVDRGGERLDEIVLPFDLL